VPTAPAVPDVTAVFDTDSPVLTPEEIERAIALEKAQLAQAQAQELARLQAEREAEQLRLQAEAEAEAIRKEREAIADAKRKEEIFLKTIPEQVAKDPHDHVKEMMGGGENLFFTVPHKLVVGNPARIYVNKSRSETLRGKHNVRFIAGFNDWKLDEWDTAMIPVGSDADDFAYSEFQVPDLAYGFNFVFEADGNFENSGGDNFFVDVHYGKTKEEVEKFLRDKAAYEKDLAEATAECETEKYEAGMRKEGVPEGQLEKDGRVIFKTDRGVKPGKTFMMFNKALNPIGGPNGAIRLHVGFNKFAQGFEQELIMDPVKGAPIDPENEWYGATVDIPPTSYTVDMVVSDEAKEHWDNNDGYDYRLLVEGGEGNATNEDWDARIQERIVYLAKMREEREEAARVAAKERRKRREAAHREATLVTRRQQQHIITCDPPYPKAGDEVKITYHPTNTNLGLAQDVYITGGFNRWTHETEAIPATAMTRPTEASPFVEFSVKIPEDAWMMDFVFSDGVGEGSTYDNHFGRDYHFPVEDSTIEKPPLHIAHIAVEMAPIAKVGGLGDVVTALARAIQDEGNLVEVILPKYQFFNSSPMLGNMEFEASFEALGTNIVVTRQIVEDVQVFFVEPQNGMFAVDSVYGRNDDGVKFDFFCNAALEFLLQTSRQPDILHCHDWSTATVAASYWTNYHNYGLWKPKVVFTIHNMNYGQQKIGEASFHSQLTTTVSPSYAGEVSGHPAVRDNLHKFHGVRNGIDSEIWDPSTDQFLPMNYDASNHEAGKRRAREEIQGRFGLTWGSDQPMVAVVSRLTAQKGLDLIKHSIHHSLKRGAQYVLLGSAPDPKVQGDFNAMAGSIGGPNAAFAFAFDEPLSHLVYAAADFILVPSMFEPCGLTQMISMRYGAVPVVRATGGLRDTIFDVDNEKDRAAWEVDGSTDWKVTGDATNGFSFEGTDIGGLEYALDRALDTYYNDRIWFRQFQERIMRQDWSWNRPALDYVELYYSAIRS
jgi:starch synthase